MIDKYDKREDRVNLTYRYLSETDEAYIELPMFYYPGYEVKLGDGTRLNAGTGDYNHMRVYLPYADTETELNIRFRVSVIWSLLVLFSVASFVFFLHYGCNALKDKQE